MLHWVHLYTNIQLEYSLQNERLNLMVLIMKISCYHKAVSFCIHVCFQKCFHQCVVKFYSSVVLLPSQWSVHPNTSPSYFEWKFSFLQELCVMRKGGFPQTPCLMVYQCLWKAETPVLTSLSVSHHGDSAQSSPEGQNSLPWLLDVESIK